MIRILALAALIAAPATGAIPTATGTAAFLPAGAPVPGVSASFAMPVTKLDRGAPQPSQPGDKTRLAASCL